MLGSEVEHVTVFEAKPEDSSVGGHAVAIMGGMKIFEFIGLLEELIAVGYPIEKMTAMNTYGLELFDFLMHDIFRATKNPNLLSSPETGERPLAYFCSRGCVQKVLARGLAKDTFNKFVPREIQERTTVDLKYNCPVVHVHEYNTPNGKKVAIQFENNRVEDDFDIVLGCDGAQSKVKDYILQEAYAEDPDSDPRKDQLAFCGIRTSFTSTGPDPEFKLRKPRGPRQWYGDGIYAMEATVGGVNGPEHYLGISYASKEDAKMGENTKWGQGSNAMREELRKLLVAKGFGAHKEFMNIFDNTERLVELGIRAIPRPLKTWHSKSSRVVLIGDSAHKM